MTNDESTKLIDQLECAELAKKHFINGSINFEDFLDILGLCEIDIDNYLITVEENILETGIIL